MIKGHFRAVAVGGLAVALLLAGCSGGEETPEAVPSATSHEPLAAFLGQTLGWSDCGGGFECADMTVPVDYSEPSGDTIEIKVNRLPATGDRAGALIVNPGGPGASGLDYATSLGPGLSDDMLDAFDVVGFDPRGVGQSAPVDCLDDSALDELILSDPTPDTQAEREAFAAASLEFATGCAQKTGALLGHVGTLDVARDLDLLRGLLGDETLTYLGKSYGTTIGQVYAAEFPQRVGSMVLDGVVDLEVEDPEFSLQQALGFETALQRFAQWCVKDGSCAAGDDANDVVARVQGLFVQTDDEPLPAAGGTDLVETLAFYGVLLPLYLPESDGFPALEGALAQAYQGDGTTLVSYANQLLDRTPNGDFLSNSNEAISAVNCLDRRSGLSFDDAADAVPTFQADAPVFGAPLAWSLASCDVWPKEPTLDPGAPAISDVPPILVVGTTGDTATPYQWAADTAERIPDAVLLTWESTSHTAYQRGDSCIDDAVDAFYLEGTLPEPGTRC